MKPCIGDQISILRDGAVIQDGDPQDIIMRPADDYISDFIKDINRGRVIKVSTLMTKASRVTGPKFENSALLEDVLTTLNQSKTDAGAIVDSTGKGYWQNHYERCNSGDGASTAGGKQDKVQVTEIKLELAGIYKPTHEVMLANGCDADNAAALADIIHRAERDGSHSHGLFRVPGYVKALRSGKVNGKAKPIVRQLTPAVIQVDGNGCFAPIAQAVGLPLLADATGKIGIAALSLIGVHHFAALWPETEYLADRGFVGLACTAYMPMVAPAGSKEAFFGTNQSHLLGRDLVAAGCL